MTVNFKNTSISTVAMVVVNYIPHIKMK